MTLEGCWITSRASQAVIDAIEAQGNSVYFVGGCVRNAVMGLPVSDIDMASDARPERILEAAEQAGIKAIPTGAEHGTVTLVVDGVAHEVTSFRKDVETDGRHARVIFGTDIVQDAARRDFTMNALYADGRGEIIDPLGTGLVDARARRLRFIGAADRRIAEDYLRIPRFFRFLAWYSDPDEGVDPTALDAIARNLDGLQGLSRERVGAELVKLLSASDPAPALGIMQSCGALARVLPGAESQAIAPLVHGEMLLGLSADPMRRLAGLGSGENWADLLRLSRAQASALALYREQIGAMTGVAELAYRFDEHVALGIAALRSALLETPLTGTEVEQARQGQNAVFPLRAVDLMGEFQGPSLGAELKRREAEWIASGFALTREALLGG